MSAAQLQDGLGTTYFDVYLLAHSFKDHLLDARFYKRVYRNQGWISPVLLIDGKIAGVWAYDLSRQTINIEIELFARISRSVRAQIEVRAKELGGLFQRAPSLSFKSQATDCHSPELRFPGESSRLPPVRIRCLA